MSQIKVYFVNEGAEVWPNKVPFMELRIGQIFRWSVEPEVEQDRPRPLCIKTSRQHFLAYFGDVDPEQQELPGSDLGGLTDPLPMQIRES